MPSPDLASLLGSLWETHVDRGKMYAESNRVAAEYAARGLGASGIVAAETARLRRDHLESAVHWTLDEFEKRAPHDDSTRDFLTDGSALRVLSAKIQRDLQVSLPGGSPSDNVALALHQQRGQDAAGLLHLAGERINVLAHSLAPGGGAASASRVKDQKFGILDAPPVDRDLAGSLGVFGAGLIYLDIDHFKEVNTMFTERVVDKTILPEFQRLVVDATGSHGYAYAEGGDEVVVLLPNSSRSVAVAFAIDLLMLVRSTAFAVESARVPLTISVGLALASTSEELAGLPERANLAKKHAKEQGRDRVSLWTPAGCEAVSD